MAELIDGATSIFEEALLTAGSITSVKVPDLRFVSLYVTFHGEAVLAEIVRENGFVVPSQTVSVTGVMTLTGRGFIEIFIIFDESTQQFDSPE